MLVVVVIVVDAVVVVVTSILYPEWQQHQHRLQRDGARWGSLGSPGDTRAQLVDIDRCVRMLFSREDLSEVLIRTFLFCCCIKA